MAAVVEFYVPETFRPKRIRASQLERGKLVEFSSVRKSKANSTGFVFGEQVNPALPSGGDSTLSRRALSLDWTLRGLIWPAST